MSTHLNKKTNNSLIALLLIGWMLAIVFAVISAVLFISIKNQDNEDDSRNSVQETSYEFVRENEAEYEKYAVLSISPVDGSKRNYDNLFYQIDYKITNNSNWTLLDAGARLNCFDAEGTVIESKEFSLGYSLESGKSGILTFQTSKDFDHCEIASYNYQLHDENEILPGNSNLCVVDVITKSVKYRVRY